MKHKPSEPVGGSLSHIKGTKAAELDWMELVFHSCCQLSTVTVSRYLWALTARTLFLARDRLPRSWWIYFFRKSISSSSVLLCSWSVTALRNLPGPSSGEGGVEGVGGGRERGGVHVIQEQINNRRVSVDLITWIWNNFFFLQQSFKQCVYFFIDFKRSVTLFSQNQATLLTSPPYSL